MVCRSDVSHHRAPTGSWLAVKQEGLALGGGVPLVYVPSAFSLMRLAGIQRKHTQVVVHAAISDCPRRDFLWHQMIQRLDVGGRESRQRHSQHHTCSFFNHDRVLPILGNLNSESWFASNRGISTACISPEHLTEWLMELLRIHTLKGAVCII